MQGGVFDLLIVGGGINGAGIAADAAGRGLSVCMIEMDDLASGTSQWSSKLIHGGLRYLEQYEFRLVREALAEREIMLARAPHLVRPLRFIMPGAPEMRSSLRIRAGLLLYDHLARRRRIPKSRAVDLALEPAGRALGPQFRSGFAYWDCSVDDARLVVLNARLAASLGALIRTRTKVLSIERGEDAWLVTIEDAGGRETCRAHAIVNAGGPWAGIVAGLARGNAHQTPITLSLVKGSHIVVPRIADANDAYLLQNSDGRAVFILPFEGDFTLIGTTDVPVTGSPSDAVCTTEEEDYLIAAANRFLAQPLTRGDIVWRFAGVRPLQAGENGMKPSALSRDYQLVQSGDRRGEILLTVIGGKITTYRALAESVIQRLRPYFPGLAPSWTARRPLPGGDIPNEDFDLYLEGLARLYAWLPEPMMQALARRHGSLVNAVVGDARRLEDMGKLFAGGLSEREVSYLVANEWAITPEDVLWRRSKAGLHYPTMDARKQAAASLAAIL